MEINLTNLFELFEFPFLQRALIGGIFMGLMGGLLGSFTILRQLSFFSDTLGHSALLGITIGFLLGLNPSVVLLPFAVLFAIAINYLLEHTKLWTDALLNIIYSSSLAIAIIILSFTDRYKGGVDDLLFGDILGVQNTDLIISGILAVICLIFIALTFRIQMMITLNENMAIARGISVTWHRSAFIILLSLVVGVSIKAIGVLLVSAFVVIPACAARLLSKNFSSHLIFSASLGAFSAILGIIFSAMFNLPSGPSIVVMQLTIFLISIVISKVK
jgi:zinc transport system permease protein